MKNAKKLFDGIDQERFNGLFLPLGMKESRRDPKNIKELLMDNIENILDEIIDDLEKNKKR